MRPEWLILLVLACVPVLGILVKSDIGQAIADAIRHNSGASQGAALRHELEQMQGELDQLRASVDELHLQLQENHERLEFAERLLSQRSDVSLPTERSHP